MQSVEAGDVSRRDAFMMWVQEERKDNGFSSPSIEVYKAEIEIQYMPSP